MNNLNMLLISLFTLSYTLIKGSYMEGRIDKIDVKREHKELIALFYQMELKAFVQRLMYEHSTNRAGRIKRRKRSKRITPLRRNAKKTRHSLRTHTRPKHTNIGRANSRPRPHTAAGGSCCSWFSSE